MLAAAEIDPNLVLAPFVLACIGIAAVCWFAMLGGSLKISLGMTTEAAPSYLRCTVMAFFIIAINIGVFIGFHMTLGPQPWYITAGYQTLLQALMIALIARCNPISAFFATIAHGVFSGMGTVVIAIVMVLVLGSSMKGLQERGGDLFGLSDTAAETADAEEAAPSFTPVLHPGEQANPFMQ